MTKLNGRVALVTGAGSPQGIGFATARLLAGAGAVVAVTATSERIFKRAAELGKGHRGYVADLSDPAAAANLVAKVRRDFGRLDIVVNNAGMVQTGRKSVASRVEKISDAEWQEHLRLNLATTFHVIRAVLPIMQRRRYGRIVNVSSVTGPMVVNPKGGGYAACKAAISGLTRAVAIENARRGITCNAVLPGWIATASQTPHEVAAGKATPIGRSGTPEEVAACILFLASDEASYVTGTTLVVDGANSIAEFKGAPGDWY